MERKFESVASVDLLEVGGINYIAEIMNNIDRGTEKFIFDELNRIDPKLSDEIRKRMFVFEDIVTLDNASIQRVLREVDTRDLALALKISSEDVVNIIYRNLSKRASQTLREDIEFMGPVRLIEAESAQQRIVGIIRTLDETNEIVISRGGDNVIIP